MPRAELPRHTAIVCKHRSQTGVNQLGVTTIPAREWDSCGLCHHSSLAQFLRFRRAICSTDRTYSCQAVTCGQFSDIDVCSNLHWQNFCSKVSSWVMAWFAYLDSRGWRDSTIAVCLGSSALGIISFVAWNLSRLINLPLFLSCLVEMLGEK